MELGSSKWTTEEVGISRMYDMDGEVRKLRKIFSVGEMEPITFFKLEGCLGVVKLPPFQLCKIEGSSKCVCSAIIFRIIKTLRLSVPFRDASASAATSFSLEFLDIAQRC